MLDVVGPNLSLSSMCLSNGAHAGERVEQSS
jgi:hypothetical protein